MLIVYVHPGKPFKEPGSNVNVRQCKCGLMADTCTYVLLGQFDVLHEMGSFFIIIRDHEIMCPFMANVTQSEP